MNLNYFFGIHNVTNVNKIRNSLLPFFITEQVLFSAKSVQINEKNTRNILFWTNAVIHKS